MVGRVLVRFITVLALPAWAAAADQNDPGRKDWLPLFNGRDLSR